jgi:hypothetical protein
MQANSSTRELMGLGLQFTNFFHVHDCPPHPSRVRWLEKGLIPILQMRKLMPEKEEYFVQRTGCDSV